MQDTESLWSQLCGDLAFRSSAGDAASRLKAVHEFEASAKASFQDELPRLRDALEIAGDIYSSNGDEKEALRCFKEALAHEETGEIHQRARLATKAAMLEEAGGDLNAARHFYNVAITSAATAHDHTHLPTLLNNLGGILRALGEFPAAEGAYNRAIVEAELAHGPNHPEVALFASNLGVAYADHGDYAKAENLHLRALQIRERNFRANHPDVGQSLANLAAVYHARHLHIKAEKFYLSALDTLRHFYSADDPCLRQIEENYHRLPQVEARDSSSTRRLRS